MTSRARPLQTRSKFLSVSLVLALTAVSLVACGGHDSTDANGIDTGDANSGDVTMNADSPADVAADARRDAALDTADAHSDSAVDAGTDARSDAGTDAGSDAVTDTGSDAGSDAGGDGGHTTGADQPGYVCPPSGTTGTVVSVDVGDSSAVATNKINTAPVGATICINGYHRLTAGASLRSNQHVIGVSGTHAALSGAVALADATHWHAAGSGIWYYDGPEVPATETLQTNWAMGAVMTQYDVAVHADDVFYDDQRMMRVLALNQVPDTGPLPPGESLYPTMMGMENGRFWYDGGSTPPRIYVNRDPTAAGANIEIATLDTVVLGSGTDVTIENLTVEKAVNIALNAGTNWIITDSTVRFAHHIGLGFPNGTSDTQRAVMTRLLITNNGQYGFSTTNNQWFTLQDSELSWNNLTNFRAPNSYFAAGSSKIWSSVGTSIAQPGVEIIGLDSHHNVGAGLWFDGHNQYVVVRGGHYHHNEGSGIFYEISCDVDISGAEVDHNGMPIMNTDMPDAASSGIHVSHSNNADVHNNVVYDNPMGIALSWSGHGGMVGRCFVTNPPNPQMDISDAMKNARVHDNIIYMCAGTHSGASLGSFSLSSRNDIFATNEYHVASASGTFWRDTALEGWTMWTAASGAGQDMGSATPMTSCTYP